METERGLRPIYQYDLLMPTDEPTRGFLSSSWVDDPLSIQDEAKLLDWGAKVAGSPVTIRCTAYPDGDAIREEFRAWCASVDAARQRAEDAE